MVFHKIYAGYTQKNGEVSKVNKKFTFYNWKVFTPIFTGMYGCFSIVFFSSAGSDMLQKETTTSSLGHPVRRI